MTFLDFDTYKLKKCCNNLEKEIRAYDDYWLENGKLMVEVEYDDDCYHEHELEECPSCGAPLLYYQTVDVPMKYCKKTMKICYVVGDCKEGVDIKRVIGDNFIDSKSDGIIRVAGIKGYSYEC